MDASPSFSAEYRSSAVFASKYPKSSHIHTNVKHTKSLVESSVLSNSAKYTEEESYEEELHCDLFPSLRPLPEEFKQEINEKKVLQYSLWAKIDRKKRLALINAQLLAGATPEQVIQYMLLAGVAGDSRLLPKDRSSSPTFHQSPSKSHRPFGYMHSLSTWQCPSPPSSLYSPALALSADSFHSQSPRQAFSPSYPRSSCVSYALSPLLTSQNFSSRHQITTSPLCHSHHPSLITSALFPLHNNQPNPYAQNPSIIMPSETCSVRAQTPAIAASHRSSTGSHVASDSASLAASPYEVPERVSLGVYPSSYNSNVVSHYPNHSSSPLMSSRVESLSFNSALSPLETQINSPIVPPSKQSPIRVPKHNFSTRPLSEQAPSINFEATTGSSSSPILTPELNEKDRRQKSGEYYGLRQSRELELSSITTHSFDETPIKSAQAQPIIISQEDMGKCPICSRSFFLSRLGTHEAVCQQRILNEEKNQKLKKRDHQHYKRKKIAYTEYLRRAPVPSNTMNDSSSSMVLTQTIHPDLEERKNVETEGEVDSEDYINTSKEHCLSLTKEERSHIVGVPFRRNNERALLRSKEKVRQKEESRKTVPDPKKCDTSKATVSVKRAPKKIASKFTIASANLIL